MPDGGVNSGVRIGSMATDDASGDPFPMSEDAVPMPGKDGLFLACEEVARTTLWRQGERSNDVVETLAQNFYRIACEHREFVRQNCDTDDVIENAVRYLARIHAMPPSGTDTRWFSTSMEVLIQLAVPNAGNDEVSAKYLNDAQRGIIHALGDVPVSRELARVTDADAELLSRLVDAGCEHGIATEVFDLVDRLYHGHWLDEDDMRFFRLIAMAAPLTRQRRRDEGIDK